MPKFELDLDELQPLSRDGKLVAFLLWQLSEGELHYCDILEVTTSTWLHLSEAEVEVALRELVAHDLASIHQPDEHGQRTFIWTSKAIRPARTIQRVEVPA